MHSELIIPLIVFCFCLWLIWLTWVHFDLLKQSKELAGFMGGDMRELKDASQGLANHQAIADEALMETTHKVADLDARTKHLEMLFEDSETETEDLKRTIADLG